MPTPIIAEFLEIVHYLLLAKDDCVTITQVIWACGTVTG